MNKHTPGPWVVYEFVDGYEIRSPEAECWVATASDPEAGWGAIGREEDARLIAAAPDLLEALERVKETGVYFGAVPHDMVNAALAKAKGEE